MGGADVIEYKIRELIRRQRLDPAHDQQVLHGLVRDAVQDYEERSLHGGLAPFGKREQATQRVLDTVLGFAPLQRYLDDPQIEEIWINEPTLVI